MLSAAKSLRANVATVSRRIERVTNAVGETLFVRHGAEWQPTETGIALIELARRIERKVGEVSAMQSEGLPTDTVVRLSVAIPIMQTFISHCISNHSFRDFPNIDMTHQPLSLAYAETDVAVTYEQPEYGNFICAKVGSLNIVPYVSKNLKEPPKDWIEIIYGQERITPRNFDLDLPQLAKLKVEGLSVAALAMESQPFAAFFPCEFADDHPNLRRLDERAIPRNLSVWMSYHATRKLDPIVRSGVQIVQRCFH